MSPLPLRTLATALALVLASCAGCSTSTTGATDTNGGTPVAQGCTFRNPLAYGQDPWVVRQNGTYHLVQSGDRAIQVYRSARLTEVTKSGTRVWTAPDTGWNRTNIWAPELHFLDGKWYVYYAAGRAGPPFVHQRSGVLESAGADPLGPYADKGPLFTGDEPGGENVWAIDLTVARIGGQLYAVWSGWERNATTDRTPQHLYIAPMSNPWTISGRRVKLSSPTESWERGTELDLQEGPQFLQRNGETFVVYSTRESWLRHYKLGLLRLRAGAPPLDPASWTKSGPVFSPTDQVFGVGHASFTTSPDGSEDWIVYHAKIDTVPGWTRVIRMQKFTWSADGTPSFGTPIPSSEPVPAPKGECQ
jgi:GH43 family beta-xylosidase